MAFLGGPLPDWTRQPAIRPSIPFCSDQIPRPLSVSEVAPGVFVHEGKVEEVSPDNAGDIANLGFVIGDTSVAVIDAGSSRQIAEVLYAAIRTVTEKPISHLVLTHMHPDHVMGAAVFREAGATIVGAATLPRALADRAETYNENTRRDMGDRAFLGTTIVMPDRLVEGGMQIDLGRRRLVLQTWPTAHTTNDLTVLDADTGMLFAGDLLFDRHTPSLDGSLIGWLAVLDDMKTLDARRVVPGHGRPLLPFPDALEPEKRYLDTLARDTRAAIAAGSPLSAATKGIAAGERENWRLFDLYNPRNATTAYTELEWE
ncbi:quinoprotein relay system zinc metallohydrolase 2 [Rhizobium halophytocola]|nr:quinoprotein relay system zinc metallohydrolase 2 [Rhizobium halophytocola]